MDGRMVEWTDGWRVGLVDGREAAGWLEGHLMDRWLVGKLARGRIV